MKLQRLFCVYHSKSKMDGYTIILWKGMFLMGENCMEKSAQEIMEDLKKPFAPEDIEWRVRAMRFLISR